jgi:hypothetical protein
MESFKRQLFGKFSAGFLTRATPLRSEVALLLCDHDYRNAKSL